MLTVDMDAADARALDADDVDVRVGAVDPAGDGAETPDVRDRVRDFAATRLKLARGTADAAESGAAFAVEKLAARLSR